MSVDFSPLNPNAPADDHDKALPNSSVIDYNSVVEC